MICSNCSGIIPDDSILCPECGACTERADSFIALTAGGVNEAGVHTEDTDSGKTREMPVIKPASFTEIPREVLTRPVRAAAASPEPAITADKSRQEEAAPPKKPARVSKSVIIAAVLLVLVLAAALTVKHITG